VKISMPKEEGEGEWWRRRESNRTSVLKTLNLLILGMPELA